MVYIAIIVSALIAGIIQGVSGFGAGTVFMCAVPYFMGVTTAAAVSNCMSISLNAMMTYRYRQAITTRTIWIPALFFIAGGTISIWFSTGMDNMLLKLILGVFLILLAVFFILFNRKIHIKVNVITMFLCGFFSGVTDGLFNIGGPLMVLFFLAATASKEEYLGTISLFFLIVSSCNFVFRIIRGIFTVALLPYAIAALITVFAGLQIGNRVVDRIDTSRMKKITYGLIGISGLMTFITALKGVYD